jgi:glycosyltransferase involved in cell wall biosynthesis
MKISFAITVHNEGEYIWRLGSELIEYINTEQTEDEIVILDDMSTDPLTLHYLDTFKKHSFVKIIQHKFESDFAKHKNHLNSLCTGEYIFQIDADEWVSYKLLYNLHAILESNPAVDLYFVPRYNRVNGLTPQHIAKWGWRVDNSNRVMWPDWQGRIYKNSSKIKWEYPVHERIVGATEYSFLPEEEDFSLIHLKDIDRQEKQNALYETIK